MCRIRSGRAGFSVIELLVAMAVLSLLMVAVLQITTMASRSWQHSRGKIEAFQESRAAYETMTRKIRQATLNTYWDYDNFISPTRYQRASELHFFSGPVGHPFLSSLFPSSTSHCIFFQAPVGFSGSADFRGLETLLNAVGYYTEFGNDDDVRPGFVPEAARRWRYRLKEWQAPAEQLLVYTKTSGDAPYDDVTWIDLSTNARTLAENIIALVILPKLSEEEDAGGAALTTDYFYDSRTPQANDVRRHQLPPLVQVVMVAIDEKSAQRLADKYGSQSPGLVPPSLFRESASLTADLVSLENILNAKPGNPAGNTIPLNYVIFNSQISLRGAKWSSL